MPQAWRNDTNAYTNGDAQCHSYTDFDSKTYSKPKTSSYASASPDVTALMA